MDLYDWNDLDVTFRGCICRADEIFEEQILCHCKYHASLAAVDV